jgi:oxygen-independent coproporphyrinogen-3 oxidase
VRKQVPVEDYLRSLRRELDVRFSGAWSDAVRTLYLGGGTPSRLGGDGVERLLDLIRSAVPLPATAEITLEANPEDVNADAAAQWRRAGVTRLSLGVQSLNDTALAWMHRVHDGVTARRALDTSLQNFERVSADLIFALPPDIPRSLDDEIATLVCAGVTHVSAYGLTEEPFTPYARWLARGDAAPASDETWESEFLTTHRLLTEAGLEHYEVSNFASPGQRSRHNSAYWDGSPYVGLGPAAHGYDGCVRRWNVDAYDRWMKLLADGLDPCGGSETLTPENRCMESVFLGMRTVEGLSLEVGEGELVEPWVRSEWANVDAGRLRLTPLGWLRLNTLAATLTNFRSR